MRAAVLGFPIDHSLSPVLHRAAYAGLGLHDWRYDKFECAEAALPLFVEGLGEEWAGLSLTMPLKRVALDVADEISPVAEATGAANTLVFRDGRILADNTDVTGIVEPLRAAGVAPGARAVVLGAGGTAQAAVAALRELGIGHVSVLVRDAGRAGELRATATRVGAALAIEATLGHPGRAAATVAGADVVVSTLPAGAADALADALTAAPAVLLDVIYDPWPTALGTACGNAGAVVLGGREMLLHQAVAQVRLMTGRAAPVEAMRQALDATAQRGRWIETA